MTGQAVENVSLTLVRTLDARPADVFQAWTDSEVLAQWFAPGAVTVDAARVDARVGGEFYVRMHTPDGGHPAVRGVFREVIDAERERYREIYPLGKVPLLVLDDGHLIPESSIIIEFLDGEFDSGTRLIPRDASASRETRFHDRMLDLYLNESVPSLVFESWKPEEERDPEVMERARFRGGVMYDFLDSRLAGRTWIMGDDFTLADCAAAPPLFYAQQFLPFEDRPGIAAYWSRLRARASWQAVAAEMAPHLDMLRAGPTATA